MPAFESRRWLLVDRALLDLGNDFLGDTGFGLTEVVMWLWFLFNMTYLVGKRGQSWGREIWGLKVVDYSGEPIGFFRALFRNLFAIYVSAPVLYLGFLWMLWDGRRQAWHDKVFRTFVLRRAEGKP